MGANDPWQTLITRVLAGDRRSIARLLSRFDDREPGCEVAARLLAERAGRAHVVGITGVPGAGKSTLVNALLGAWLEQGLKVGVIAVDPSSPIHGGAVLGDRVRMGEHGTHPNAYIRSFSARGALGGLSRATRAASDCLDAAGFDKILVETVGAGQSETDIMALADTRVVVCPPGLGDEVQAIKAGLMEVADIFVVSKGDHPMASETERDLTFMLGMRPAGDWMPPVLRVTATKDEGIGALADALDRHAGRQNGGRTGTRLRVRRLIASDAAALVRSRIAADESPAMDRICEAVLDGTLSDREAALGAILLALRDPEPSNGPRPKGAAAPSGKFHHNTSE